MGGIRRTSEVTGDMVALSAGRPAILPLAGQAQIAGALPADVIIAEVVVESFGVGEDLVAADPLTGMAGGGLVSGRGRGRGGGRRRGALGLGAVRRLGGGRRGRGGGGGGLGRLAHEGEGEEGVEVEVVWVDERVELAMEGVLESGKRNEMGERLLSHGRGG